MKKLIFILFSFISLSIFGQTSFPVNQLETDSIRALNTSIRVMNRAVLDSGIIVRNGDTLIFINGADTSYLFQNGTNLVIKSDNQIYFPAVAGEQYDVYFEGTGFFDDSLLVNGQFIAVVAYIKDYLQVSDGWVDINLTDVAYGGVTINNQFSLSDHDQKLLHILDSTAGDDYGLYVDMSAGTGADTAAVFLGKVGVNTASPSNDLDITGTARIINSQSGNQSILQITESGDGNDNCINITESGNGNDNCINITESGNGTDYGIKVSVGGLGTNYAGVFTGGNVGIGTNTPSDNLQVVGSITTDTLIGGTSTTSDLYLQTTTGAGASGADMHFLVGNNGATEAMTILNNGNVGIGTNTPSDNLQVVGSIAADGLKINSLNENSSTDTLLSLSGDTVYYTLKSSICSSTSYYEFIINPMDCFAGCESAGVDEYTQPSGVDEDMFYSLNFPYALNNVYATIDSLTISFYDFDNDAYITSIVLREHDVLNDGSQNAFAYMDNIGYGTANLEFTTITIDTQLEANHKYFLIFDNAGMSAVYDLYYLGIIIYYHY